MPTSITLSGPASDPALFLNRVVEWFGVLVLVDGRCLTRDGDYQSEA
jgi:hypothetical protein